MCPEVRHLMLAGAAALMVSGCATTPQDRIRRHAELFASFPPEIQAKVRAGRVEPGFTPDMVRIALGRPDRVITRLTPEGETVVWVYTDAVPETWSEPVPVFWPYRSAGGVYRWYPDIFWSYRTAWRERDAARVEFRDGRVTAVERVGP
ncbi:MAG: hypothetical protein N2652_09955 [Kiritimatiellae bacterium]|nr:hypothetical protein [Kiritimatiellia bacterium]